MSQNYPFDPHRALSSNIVREVRNLADAKRGRCIVPIYAPFYLEGLVVKHQGKVLKRGRDYHVGHKFVRGTHMTAQALYGSLWAFRKDLTGNIEIEYHTIGGVHGLTYGNCPHYSKWPNVELYHSQDWIATPECSVIAPEEKWTVESLKRCIFKKDIYFETGHCHIKIKSDDRHLIHVDGVCVGNNQQNGKLFEYDVDLTPGWHTFAFELINSINRGYITFTIYDNGNVVNVSDASWNCYIVDEPYNREELIFGYSSNMTDERTKDYFDNRYISPSKDTWEDVLNEDRYMPPVEVKFDVEKWVGEQELISELETLSNTVLGKDPTDSLRHAMLLERVMRLENIVRRGAWTGHVNNVSIPALHEIQRAEIGSSALTLAPTKTWNQPNATFTLQKKINIPTATIDIRTIADNSVKIFIDGVQVASPQVDYNKPATDTVTVTPGVHTVTFEVSNGGGPSYLAFVINDASKAIVDKSDETWSCAVGAHHGTTLGPAGGFAAEHGTAPVSLGVGELAIAPTDDWRIPQGKFTIQKEIDLPAGEVLIRAICDDYSTVYFNGKEVAETILSNTDPISVNVPAPGKYLVSVVVRNSNGPSYARMAFSVGGTIVALTDKTWTCAPGDHHDKNLIKHNLEHHHLGALHKDASAKNALKAYGKSLADLTQHIVNNCLDESDFSKFKKLADENRFSHDLVLEDGKCVIKGAAGQRTVIDLSSGNAKFISDVNMTMRAKRKFGMYAGNNRIELTKDAFTYNGQAIITVDNLLDHVNSPNISFSIKTADTDTMRFEGQGRVGSPLKGHINLRDASETVEGIAQLSSSVTEGSSNKAATPKAAKALRVNLNRRVSKSRKINGRPLHGDISLTASDFNLEQTNNTSDANKPVSRPQRTHLDKYSPKNHTHPAEEFGLPKATDTAKGVGYALRLPSVDNMADGIASSLANTIYERTVNAETETRNMLENTVLDVKYYINNGEVEGGGSVVSIKSNAIYYTKRNEYTILKQDIDIAEKYPSYKSRKFYIYVDLLPSGDEATYVIHDRLLPDTDTMTRVGHVRTDSTGIVECVVEKQINRLGEFREFEEHLNDPTAHQFARLDGDVCGLGLVENRALRHTLFRPTFKEVFDSWKRISHKFDTSDQPAEEVDIRYWEYDEGLDLIKCTRNTTTFVGFVSPTEIGDGVFETEIGICDNAGPDNDAIIIIIGYDVDENGREHTLSVVRAGSVEEHMKVQSEFSIVYNYHQADQQTVAHMSTNDRGTWLLEDRCRIKVTRKDNKYVVESTDRRSINGGYIHKLECDMNADARLARFKGQTSFGYGAMSQYGASFKNLQRPDEQRYNYYAALDMVRDVANKARGMTVITGVASHGVTLPQFENGKLAEFGRIHWLAQPYDIVDTGSGMIGWCTSIDRNGLVTGQVTYKAGAKVACNVSYFLVIFDQDIV